MNKSIIIFILAFFLVACNNNSSEQDNKQDTAVTAGSDSVVPSPVNEESSIVPANDSAVLPLTNQILADIKKKDYLKFSEYIHPADGIRFSPYGYIDSAEDVHLSGDQFVEILKNKQQKLNWGSYDGSGDTILLTVPAYFARFVYDVDFLKPEKSSLNKFIGFGNSLNNLQKIYPGCPFTERHFSGFDKKYEGMDWRSLRLVFKKHAGKYYLVGVVHDQWTI